MKLEQSILFMLFVPKFIVFCQEDMVEFTKEEEECNLDGLCVNFLLEVTLVLSKGECYLKCHENPQCEWYTYNYDHDGTCHLNKGCNSVVLLNQGFVRSHQNCEVLKCNLQRHTYNFS